MFSALKNSNALQVAKYVMHMKIYIILFTEKYYCFAGIQMSICSGQRMKMNVFKCIDCNMDY
jgi:hypothetical protein